MRIILAIGVIFTTCVATDAYADKTAAAQEIVSEAEKAFVAKDFDEALRLYSEARAMKDAPLLVYMTARCLEQLGRLEDALDRYTEYLKVSDDSAVAGRATTAVRLLRERLATGTLVLQVTPFGAEVFIDGKAIGVAPVPPQRMTPRTYAIRVTHEGQSRESTVDVRGGRTVDHVVALDVPGGARSPEAAPAVGPNIGALVLLGVGAAVGIAGGGAAIAGELELQSVADGAGSSPGAPGTMTQREAADAIDGAETTRTAGLVVAGIGVAAAIAGGVWLAIDSADGDNQGTVLENAAVTPFSGGAAFVLGGSF